MSWGLRVKRGGVVEMDNLTNMGRFVGRVNTAGADGSVTDDGLLTGTPEWQVIAYQSSSPSIPSPYATPTISVSGNTLSWSYPDPTTGLAPAPTPVIIVYWVR